MIARIPQKTDRLPALLDQGTLKQGDELLLGQRLERLERFLVAVEIGVVVEGFDIELAAFLGDAFLLLLQLFRRRGLVGREVSGGSERSSWG